MFFDTNRLTKKELRLHICSFAKQVGVKKVIFNDKAKYVSGTFNPTNNIIFISLNQTKKQMLHTLFHELAHYYAVLNKKWTKYHFKLYKRPNPELYFLIENKIDKLAKSIWNENVDKKRWGNYKYFYLKSRKKELTNYFNI
jgi:Zn-dependent peptidase ImmA (M78 family)